MPGLNIEAKQLRLAVMLAEHGTLTRAGRVLSLSQSALSQQLTGLEKQLGAKLFHRFGKRMVPTAAGAALIAGARPVLSELRMLEERLVRIASGKSRHIRLGTQCYSVFHWLPAALACYRAEAPQVDIEIVGAATHAPQAALLDGIVDVALLHQLSVDPRLRTIPVFADELVLIVDPTHPLAKRPFVTAGDLAKEHVFTYAVPQGHKSALAIFMGSLTPARLTQVYWAGAIVEFVKARMGVGLLAPWSVDDEMKSGRVVARSLGASGMRRQWVAATLYSQGADPNIDGLLTALCARAPASESAAVARDRASARRSAPRRSRQKPVVPGAPSRR
jgi:LysR family transcriptional regulator, regulator for metE and metH